MKCIYIKKTFLKQNIIVITKQKAYINQYNKSILIKQNGLIIIWNIRYNKYH